MIILRQKEFGLAERRDRKIARLQKRIAKDYDKIKETNRNISELRKKIVPSEDYKLIRKMKKVAKNEGRTKIISGNNKGWTGRVPNNINVRTDKTGHFRNFIYYNPDHGAGGVAHEIGHSLEREKKNWFGNYIDKESDIARQEHYEGKDKDHNAIIAGLKSKAILINEKRASKQGQKLLKDAGASKETLRNKKKELKESLENHRATEKGNYRLRKLNRLLKEKNEPEEPNIASVWGRYMARKAKNAEEKK